MVGAHLQQCARKLDFAFSTKSVCVCATKNGIDEYRDGWWICTHAVERCEKDGSMILEVLSC